MLRIYQKYAKEHLLTELLEITFKLDATLSNKDL